MNANQAPSRNASAPRLRFSVVVPAFNESLSIAACLRSLSSQDFAGNYEVIVVDNNSTDDTADIAQSLGATVVREEKPGVCHARQRGTDIARGEIVVSTDADTTFEPMWLSTIDRAFAEDPGCVAVAGPCRFVKGPWWGSVYSMLLFRLVSLVYAVTGKVIYVTATNIAFRKGAWSGYDTRFTQGGDELDLLRRLRARGQVAFDRHNPAFTSARRLDQGLLYNLAVTLLFYYLLGYVLNRLLGRPLLGTAPPVRGADDGASTQLRMSHLVIGGGIVMIALLAGLTEHVWDLV